MYDSNVINITYSFNKKHDKLQLEVSYYNKQKATQMKIGLESKLRIRDENKV